MRDSRSQRNKLISYCLQGLTILIALALLFPSPWMVVGFVAAPGLFVVRWKVTGSPVPRSRANPLILLLLSIYAVSFALSPAHDLAVIAAGQMVASVIIFFMVLDGIHDSVDLWHTAAELLLLGMLLALIAPFTVVWTADKLYELPAFYDRIWPRLPKITNPNILAGTLAPLVPIALAFVAQGKRRWRVLGAAALALVLTILILLQSRGALFALGAGVCVWATLYRRWLLPLFPLALFALLFFDAASGGSPTQFIYGKVTATSVSTFTQRQDLWVQALYLIRESPLLGVGLGAYSRVAQVAWPHSPSEPGPLMTHAHNLFLQVALDLGLVGLAAFVVLWLVALGSLYNAYRRGIERDLTIAILAAFTVIFFHGLGDVIVWSPVRSTFVLWIFLAIAFAITERAIQEKTENSDPGFKETVPTNQK